MSLQEELKTDIRNLLNVIQAMREQYPLMPLVQAQLFLLIAQHPDISARDLMALISEPANTVSRNCGMLAFEGRPGVKTKGLGLIAILPDPKDGRRICYRLTRKGQELIKRITSALSKA